jgi:hypothetical protein
LLPFIQNLLSSRLLSKKIKIIILPVVLYGCESWSLTLREEYRLRVFENKVVRRMFGRKRKEIIGGWRELHNEELRNLYGSPNIIGMITSRRMKWVGHVACTGEKQNAYMILVERNKEDLDVGSRIILKWMLER